MKTTVHATLRRHTNYSDADYAYLRQKGYTDQEILAIWDRDASLGKPPLTHFDQPFDIVGYLNQE